MCQSEYPHPEPEETLDESEQDHQSSVSQQSGRIDTGLDAVNRSFKHPGNKQGKNACQKEREKAKNICTLEAQEIFF
jgi:hypothetical protein